MKKYQNSRAIAAILLVSAIFFSPIIFISSAEDSLLPPQIPQTFVGTLKFKNNSGIFDAPYGTRIEAFIDGIERGSTSVMSSGNYNIGVSGTIEDEGKTIKFKAEGYFAEQTAVFNASVPPPETLDLIINLPEQQVSSSSRQSSGGGGSGSGGSGGGVSGENYSNIELKEKYEETIYKDTQTSYKFKNARNPIMFINITGNVSAGLVNTIVEVLGGTSTLIGETPPGIVYKNINIWVGSSGFATSTNIKEATILFRVDNVWIDSNAIARSDIKMVRWDNGKWISLITSEKMKDGTYTFFEGKTSSFSSFAITGINTSIRSFDATPAHATPAGTPSTGANTSEKPPFFNLSIIIFVVALIAIIIIYIKYKYVL